MIERCFHVRAHGGVRVFVDGEGGRRVLDGHVQDAVAALPQPWQQVGVVQGGAAQVAPAGRCLEGDVARVAHVGSLLARQRASKHTTAKWAMDT